MCEKLFEGTSGEVATIEGKKPFLPEYFAHPVPSGSLLTILILEEWVELSLRLRVTKVDEFQFLACLKNSLWGSKSARFKDWQEGDHLAFMVNKALAAFATVAGKPFRSTEVVWDNGLFPYRIPMKFVHVLKRDQRVPILGEVRDTLTSTWGPRYGWGILTQRVLENVQAETLIKAITSRPNSLMQIEADLDTLLLDAKQERQLASEQKKPVEKKHREKTLLPAEEFGSGEEESQHSQAENSLIKLGKATGCSVLIASNDRSRIFQGKPLGEECLRSLPNLGLNEEAVRRISLIDVIWIIKNTPVCAFEVETTTSIYSGLLRMSDLLSVVPSLKISLYIVAPRNRQDRVRAELTRPTFRKIGLDEYCKFIHMEELQKLLSKVEGLQGHIQPTIIDTIAAGFEEENESI